MPTLEEMIVERSNAYEKVNTIREKWANKLDELPADVMAELQGAADVMTKLKPLIDNAQKSKDIFAKFGPDYMNQKTNPDNDEGFLPSERLNSLSWSSPLTRPLANFGVKIPKRTSERKVKNKVQPVIYNEQAVTGFEKFITGDSVQNRADSDIAAFHDANTRYNSTYRISDSERAGSFTVPEEFWTGILKNVDDQTYVHSLARVLNISAQSLAVRVRLAKANMINAGDELSDAQLNKENSLRYGKRVLTPQFHTGSFRVSNALLRDTSVNILEYIQSEIGIDIAEYLENLFLNGNGTAGPVGLLHAATVGEGIDTSRDVTLVNTAAGGFSADTLIDCRYSLKDVYARNASWMTHRLNIGRLAKLKGSDGHPLWRASMVPNVPDTLLGRPIIVNEFMPDTTAEGVYGILFGDYSYYWIVYKDMMTMQVQNELYSNTNETGYIYRVRLDAQPMLAEAFVRGKFPA